MTRRWRETKTGRIAIRDGNEEFYHNPKTGWVPVPNGRRVAAEKR